MGVQNSTVFTFSVQYMFLENSLGNSKFSYLVHWSPGHGLKYGSDIGYCSNNLYNIHNNLLPCKSLSLVRFFIYINIYISDHGHRTKTPGLCFNHSRGL